MVENESSRKRSRNGGIELLRLIAAYYIVSLHLLTHGGIRSAAAAFPVKMWVVECLYTVFSVGVNIFGMISGYVSSGSQNWAKLLKGYCLLYCQVRYYSFCIPLLVGGVSKHTFSSLLISLSPFTPNQYWYFTAFSGAFIFMHLLSTELEQLSVNQVGLLLAVFLGLFSVYDLLMPCFGIKWGYSSYWLLVLFFYGAAIRKLDCSYHASYRVLTILLISVYLVTILVNHYLPSFRFAGLNYQRGMLTEHNSPFMVLMAAFHVELCARIELSKIAYRIVTIISSSAFSIYLITDNPSFRRRYISGQYSHVINKTPSRIVSSTCTYSAVLVCLSIGVDSIRKGIIRVIKKITQS